MRIGFLLAMMLTWASAPAADLATFRATYELIPARIEQGLKAEPLEGRLGYEVAGSDCAGWTVTSDLVSRSAVAEQGLREAEMKSRSFESANGLEMTVSQQESVNGKLSDDQEVKALRQVAGGSGTVRLSGSKSSTFTFEPEVLYPTAHQKKLLQLAAAGERRDVSTVYDGSDGNKQFRIITFIGARRPAAVRSEPFLSSLSGISSWSFQLGYYNIAEPQAEAPDFQATFDMYENGVSTEMLFDYGSYTMKAKIKSYEAIAQPDCPTGQKLP